MSGQYIFDGEQWKACSGSVKGIKDRAIIDADGRGDMNGVTLFYVERCDILEDEFEERLKLIVNAPQLLIELISAQNQLDAAARCLEKGFLDEAALHVNSLRDKRMELLNKCVGDGTMFK